MIQKVFRDPIYGDIVLTLPEDAVLFALMETASFQRLRRIRQLGVAQLAFHGAEHSRFSHSMGTMHLMTITLDHLIRISGPDGKALAKYRQLGRIAALLHDIGHGPFSHHFEQIVPPRHAQRHEQWSMRIITDNTDVTRVLKKYKISPQAVADIVNHTFTKCPALQELLSGHFDVDRMDYLLRDSHATGVKYGIFDWERLLRSLVTYKKGKNLHLACTQKGLRALEELLLARYFMYQQVYLHKTVLAAEYLLKAILRRAWYISTRESLHIQNTGLRKLFGHETLSAADYTTMDDAELLAALRVWSTHHDPILADLASRFLGRKLLVTLPVPAKAKLKILKKARLAAQKAGYDPDYYVSLLDTKLSPYPNDIPSRVPEVLVSTDGKIRRGSEDSDVIKFFSGITLERSFICLPREVRGKLLAISS